MIIGEEKKERSRLWLKLLLFWGPCGKHHVRLRQTGPELGLSVKPERTMRISAGLYFSVTEQCPLAFRDAAETNAAQ